MDKLKELLGEELFESVSEKLGDKKYIFGLEENYVTKERFNQVNESVKSFKEQVSERDNQLEELKKASSGNDDLLKKLADMEATNKQYETKLTESQRNFEIDRVLLQSKVKNPKAVKALLDQEKIEFSNGKLAGVEEQIKALKDSDSYLFEDDIPTGTGFKDKTEDKKEDFTREQALKIRQGLF